MNMALKIRSLNRGSSILFPLEPKLDESIRGYLARTADWNCFESRTDLLRLAGLTYVRRDLSDRIAADIGSVSQLLGINAEALERILNPTVGDAEIVNFFGLPLSRYRLDFRPRRVSPASLRSSPHHRARWHVRPLPYCPESWEYLLDACPACEKPLRWSKCLEIDRCEHCEYDLKQADLPSVAPELRGALGLVGDLVHPAAAARTQALARLPAPLNDIGAENAFELLCVVARALTPDDLKSKNSTEPLDAEFLHLAAQALLDYPQTLNGIAQAGRGSNNKTPPAFVKLRRRAKEKSGLLKSLLLSMVDQLETVHHGPTRLAKLREEHGQWTLHRSAIWLGLPKSDLKKIADGGFLRSSPERGRQRALRWIDPAEVHALGIRLRRRMSQSEFVRSYHLPLSGMEQLVSLGVLKPCEDELVGLLYPHLQLDRIDVLGFFDRFAEVLGPSPPESVALEDVFHGIGSGEKPWGAIIVAALAGNISGGLGVEEDAPLRIQRLTLSKSFAWELLAGHHPRMLQIPARARVLGPAPDFNRLDAQRYLNCFPRDLAWLVSEGHLAAGSPGGRNISRSEVEALGRSLISSREMSWRWRISPALREALPTEHGIRRVLGPFWPRSEVVDCFQNLLPQGMPA